MYAIIRFMKSEADLFFRPVGRGSIGTTYATMSDAQEAFDNFLLTLNDMRDENELIIAREYSIDLRNLATGDIVRYQITRTENM